MLTANHGHAAMFGVFGMLGARRPGLLPARNADRRRRGRVTEKYVRVGFWGLNAGLALMVVLDLFPAGVLQLWDVISNGYWHARRLDYLMSRDLPHAGVGARPRRLGVDPSGRGPHHPGRAVVVLQSRPARRRQLG